MKLITYGSEVFEYKVIKKKRKTLGIKITNDGEVIVTSPFGVAEGVIYDIVSKKASWIIDKLNQVKEIDKHRGNEEFNDGKKVEFNGQAYLLKICEGSERKKALVYLNGDNIIVDIKSSYSNEERNSIVRNLLVDWFKEQARTRFIERTEYYAEKIGVKPYNIRIKEQKTLWGSCSGKNNINYNWKLVMAPPVVLDYVVVHELCHIVQRNHSNKFWELVEKIMPNYKELRKWLKENGRRLNI
jgi:predicted metal-dependent hydrolase